MHLLGDLFGSEAAALVQASAQAPAADTAAAQAPAHGGGLFAGMDLAPAQAGVQRAPPPAAPSLLTPDPVADMFGGLSTASDGDSTPHNGSFHPLPGSYRPRWSSCSFHSFPLHPLRRCLQAGFPVAHVMMPSFLATSSSFFAGFTSFTPLVTQTQQCSCRFALASRV